MKPKTKLILLTLLLYGFPILTFAFLPFSKSLYGEFHSFIFNLLFYGKIVFSSLGILFDLLLLYCFYLFIRIETPIENERIYLIYCGIKKILRFVFIDLIKKPFEATSEEKVSLLFYCVKIFFTPIMMTFLINNTSAFLGIIEIIPDFFTNGFSSFNSNFLTSLLFPLIFYFILTLDTLIFCFGYLFESSALKNVVKSVEPTTFGWLVAVLCYPPVNSFTGNILGWYSSDFADFGNININIFVTIISLLLFSIYVWASVALGTKASNLTNRGIVSKGPYKYARHPAYASKNLSWWIMGIPFIKESGLIAVFSLSAWTVLYFLRALTEERHLSKDKDYVEYMNKVKYMFIPGIF